jgi:TolB protein
MTGMISCNQPASPEKSAVSYKIVYNVLFNSEADNYEVFIMDMDGKTRRILPITKTLPGPTLPGKTLFISSATATRLTGTIFFMKCHRKEKTSVRFLN